MILGRFTITVLVVATLLVATSFVYGGSDTTCTISIQLYTYAGNGLLKMDTIGYSNDKGEPYSVTKFKYYIGNIRLQGKDGSEYTSKEYYLVDEDEPDSKQIVLKNIPQGEYVGISYLIGVDSIHNCSGAQSGALDPVNGMFWTWNTGYIFLKLEGKSPASKSPGHIFEFHIGGYKSPANCIRRVQLPFADKKVVLEAGKSATLDIKADVAEVMKTPVPISLKELSSVTDFRNATTIADNYTDMFSIMDIK